MLRLPTRHGFTIVELTIVIVVIAVLATITLVSYSGVQERARQAQIATTVRSYANAISTYRLTKGYWPPESARTTDARACLGDPNSYSSTYGYLTPGICNTLTSASVDTDFNTEMNSYLTNLPDLSFIKPLQFTPSSKYGRGIYYAKRCLINYCDYATTPASKLDVSINYVITSPGTCAIGTAVIDVPTTGFTTCKYVIQEGATS